MSFRAWGPKTNSIFNVSVTTSSAGVTPTGFSGGGDQCKVMNTGTTAGSYVLIAFYSTADGTPTLSIPAAGAGFNCAGGKNRCFVTAVLAGTEKQISIPATADSIATIGSAAATLLVQRGDGSV